MVHRALVSLLAFSLLAALPATAMLHVEEVISGLDDPVRLVAPGGDSRLFVVEQSGRIKVFDQDGSFRDVFLDVSGLISQGGERGLLGLAFAPDYETSGRFYINYTNSSGDTHVARYNVDPDYPDSANVGTASPVLTIDQPFSNHNGGHLEFGPDGMLYIGTGDGGSGGDPQNHAQNPQSLLGKMLRIDVNVDDRYVIPEGNPFTDEPPLDEIWALGLRNPWVYSFDTLTGDLYIADVGQGDLEEVDVQPAGSIGGENYGWRLMEGTDCFNPPSNCNDGSLTLPVHEYTHSGNPFRCSISGGPVYRGSLVPELWGRYLFADYCSDQVWAMTWSQIGGVGEVTDLTSVLEPPNGFNAISSIGQDGLGEVYILELNAGRVWRISSDTTAVEDLPAAVRLEQNVPNPFNPRTAISFVVPRGGANVRLDVVDTRGRHIRTLVDGHRAEGRNVVDWDGFDAAGRSVPAGTYLYRLRSDGVEETRKMTLLK